MKLTFPDGTELECSDDVVPKLKVLHMIREETEGGEFPVLHGTFDQWVKMVRFAETGVLTDEPVDWWAMKDPDFQELKELAKLADYINYPEFMDHVCRVIAQGLRGRGAQEIRRILEMDP